MNREREENPESPVVQFGLGVLQKERMDYPMAIEHFEKALKGARDLTPILIELGETYQLQGQDRKAIEIVERVLRTDERNRAALYLTAIVLPEPGGLLKGDRLLREADFH